MGGIDRSVELAMDVQRQAQRALSQFLQKKISLCRGDRIRHLSGQQAHRSQHVRRIYV